MKYQAREDDPYRPLEQVEGVVRDLEPRWIPGLVRPPCPEQQVIGSPFEIHDPTPQGNCNGPFHSIGHERWQEFNAIRPILWDILTGIGIRKRPGTIGSPPGVILSRRI
jgi:hypothetical protein